MDILIFRKKRLSSAFSRSLRSRQRTLHVVQPSLMDPHILIKKRFLAPYPCAKYIFR